MDMSKLFFWRVWLVTTLYSDFERRTERDVRSSRVLHPSGHLFLEAEAKAFDFYSKSREQAQELVKTKLKEEFGGDFA